MTRHGSATFEFSDRTVITRRQFDAPMGLVYDALTKPEQIRLWFPADDAPLHVCELELWVGGSYRFVWFAPGGQECAFRGTFLELEPPTRTVATWLFEGWPEDQALQTVTLTEDAGITTMVEILEFATPENLGDHFRVNDGAQSSWNKLEDLLASLHVGSEEGA